MISLKFGNANGLNCWIRLKDPFQKKQGRMARMAHRLFFLGA